MYHHPVASFVITRSIHFVVSQPRDFLLILVCIEDIPSVPYVYGQHQLVDCRGNQFSKLVPSLAQSVAAWVTEKKRPECYLNISKSVRF